MPVPGAPSYALSNLEHTVIAGLTPTWVKDVQEAFYYETPFTTAPLAIEDHRVNAQPLRDAGVQGGCRGGAVKVVNSTYPLVFRR